MQVKFYFVVVEPIDNHFKMITVCILSLILHLLFDYIYKRNFQLSTIW